MPTWLVASGFLFASLVAAGCSTHGKFVLPAGSRLEVYHRPVTPDAAGIVTTKPFFWTATGGVKYRLLQGDKVLREGRLRSKFRPVSIFWPPFALIYWPMGLNPNITYDLEKNTQK